MLKRDFPSDDDLQNRHFVQAADGTPIAYRADITDRADNDGPALVFVNGFTTSNSYWRYLLERFRGRASLVTWDLKGHGNSGAARSEEGATIEATVDDLRRVMDASGIDQATLLGFSLGAQIIMEAWRQMPERISGLVPILGPFEHTFDSALPPLVGPAFWRLFEKYGPEAADLLLSGAYRASKLPITWSLVKALGYVGESVKFEEMQPFFEHLGDVHGPTWAKLGISAHNHSAADILPTVDVPTLIVSGGEDNLAPAELGRRMQRMIPSSELMVVPEATHAGLLGQREQIEGWVERFLGTHELVGDAE